jgi:hypothetical protein
VTERDDRPPTPRRSGSAESHDGTGFEGASFGDTWVYESLVGGIPGLSLTTGRAVGLQFALFETVVLALGVGYGLPVRTVAAGTVTVAVATAGSVAMLRIGAATRELALPPTHRRLLFGSGVEVLFGVLAFAALVTYLLAAPPPTPLAALLGVGENPPRPVVFAALLLLWDLCYRTGTAWWTALVSLWSARRYRSDRTTARECRRIDAATVGFAVLELALVPVAWGDTLLVGAVVGHVLAVTAVATAATLLRRTDA